MVWSFSAHTSFRKCPRQWFFKKVVANSRAKDPLRREAYRLSKLENLQAWRGKIVDAVISEIIIPSITWRRPCLLSKAQQRALGLFTAQKQQRLHSVSDSRIEIASNGDNGTLGSFFEVEYGLPLTDEMFATAQAEVLRALENFYKLEPLWTLFRQAVGLFPQRTLSFKHGETSVQVVPDLIVFRAPAPPVILDWKVNARPLRDYWLQLVTGALALARCNSHRDWPRNAIQHSPHEFGLFEVQLLTGDFRMHPLGTEDVEEAEDFIFVSAIDMHLACGDEEAKHLRPEQFPAAQDPKTCQTCSFRKICWEALQ